MYFGIEFMSIEQSKWHSYLWSVFKISPLSECLIAKWCIYNKLHIAPLVMLLEIKEILITNNIIYTLGYYNGIN